MPTNPLLPQTRKKLPEENNLERPVIGGYAPNYLRPNSGELKSYTPTLSERVYNALYDAIPGEHIDKINKAETLHKVLGFTPVGTAEIAYDLGQALAEKKPVTAGVLSLGIFGGQMAKTANHQMLGLAHLLEKQGAGKKEIFDQTGWFRDAGKDWKFEIPFEKKLDHMKLKQGIGAPTVAENVLDRENLFTAYPQMRDKLSVGTHPQMPKTANAAFLSYPGRGKADIAFNKDYAQSADRNRLLQTLDHEIQHGVQAIEGSSKGTSSNPAYLMQNKDFIKFQADYVKKATAPQTFEDFKKELPSVGEKDAYYWWNRNEMAKVANKENRYNTAVETSFSEWYKRSAGEQESKLSETRLRTFGTKEHEKYPWEQDYLDKLPEEKQISIKNGPEVAFQILKKYGIDLGVER